MIDYEIIREMPLNELLRYYQALKAICEKHEADLRPLFNSNNPKDKIKWVECNNEYQHSKLYFDIVLNALKYKAFHGLDEYKPLSEEEKNKKEIPEKPKTKPIPKKPIISLQRVVKGKKKYGE